MSVLIYANMADANDVKMAKYRPINQPDRYLIDLCCCDLLINAMKLINVDIDWLRYIVYCLKRYTK